MNLRMNTKSLSVFIVLVTLCAALDDTVRQLKANNYQVSHSLETYANCRVGDVSCSADCSSLELCTAGGLLVTLEECPFMTICDAASKTCMVSNEGRCTLPPNEDDFKCNSHGSFPNPYNCRKYHFCYEAKAYLNISSVCEAGFAYDPLTTLCILSTEHRVCRENPIPRCIMAGDTGPQIENPNIYYICVKDGLDLVPWLFRCAHDYEVFNGVDCVPRTTTVPSSTSTPTTATTTWTTATTTRCITVTTGTPTATTTPTTATTTPTTYTTTPTTATTTPTTITTATTTPTTTPTTYTTTPTTYTTTPTTYTTTPTTYTTTPTTATSTPTTGTTAATTTSWVICS